MNRVISDTAEYGCYLYSQACEPLLKDFMAKQDINVIGTKFNQGSNQVDNQVLFAVNAQIEAHPVEVIGRKLRTYMSDMKKIAQ
jgi:ketol-acid reductoisomerase